MNAQFEFMNDALHVLAQPVTALRTALELGLRDHADQPAARKTLEECLGLADRLTQELAIFREIASLEPEPSMESCNGETMINSCVEEMAPVAEACEVELRANTERMRIECNQQMLHRAIFLLLDELIASRPSGGVSIEFTTNGRDAQLKVRPGIPPSRRQQLYRKLIEFAGGRSVAFGSDDTHCCFRISGSQQIRDECAAD